MSCYPILYGNMLCHTNPLRRGAPSRCRNQRAPIMSTGQAIQGKVTQGKGLEMIFEEMHAWPCLVDIVDVKCSFPLIFMDFKGFFAHFHGLFDYFRSIFGRLRWIPGRFGPFSTFKRPLTHGHQGLRAHLKGSKSYGAGGKRMHATRAVAGAGQSSCCRCAKNFVLSSLVEASKRPSFEPISGGFTSSKARHLFSSYSHHHFTRQKAFRY